MESPTRLLISNGLTLAIPATMMMQPARGEAVRPNCPATAQSSPGLPDSFRAGSRRSNRLIEGPDSGFAGTG